MSDGSAKKADQGNRVVANVLAILVAGLTLLPAVMFNHALAVNRSLGLLEAMNAAKAHMAPIGAIALALAALLTWLLARSGMSASAKWAWFVGMVLIWPVVAPILAIRLLWRR